MFKPSDVNRIRVLNEINTLAAFGRTRDGGITRPTFSEAHQQATHQVADWMVQAGMQVSFDRWGNLFGRLDGSGSGPCVLSGSHLDSVVNGGNYDGVLGVLSALEAARLIRENRVRLKAPLEVVSFIDEEGSRFRGLFGSTLATGSLNDNELQTVVDSSGNRFVDVLKSLRLPYLVDQSADLRRRVAFYLELHIEQGARLESAGIPVGLVTSIAGPRFWRIRLTGQADHAGASEYESRRDALLAASEIITAVRALGVNQFAETARMTVGRIQVRPNVVNVVAGEVTLDVDTRTVSEDTRQAVENSLNDTVALICMRHHIEHEIITVQDVPATIVPERVRRAVRSAAQNAGVAHQEIVSWAAHDAMVMARVCPAGMIFVPCKNGRSHCPEEYTRPEDIAAGIAVLANSLIELAGPG